MIDAVAQHLDDIAALCRQFGVRRLGIVGEALHRAATLEPPLAEQVRERCALSDDSFFY